MTAPNVASVDGNGEAATARLSTLDRLLPVWIGAAMMAGIALGRAFPDLNDQLEKVLDQFNEPLPALKDFILPGGGPAAAHCHLARTIVRRAERCVWTLAGSEQVNVEVPKYLNRLSDLLFVIARVLARHEHGSEVLWRHDRGR